jgi:DNA-binding GntR family transcriptional regulator
MIDSLWLQVGPTRTRLSVQYRRQLVGYRNHLRIIEALEGGNAASAASAMREDLERGAAALIADLP